MPSVDCEWARENISTRLRGANVHPELCESIWGFAERFLSTRCLKLLNAENCQALYASLAWFALRMSRLSEDCLEPILDLIKQHAGLRSALRSLIGEPSPIRLFTAKRDTDHLIRLVTTVCELHVLTCGDRPSFERLLAQQLAVSLETARSHIDQSSQPVVQIDPEQGVLHVILPGADEVGREAIRKLSERLRSILQDARPTLEYWGLKYHPDAAVLENAVRPLSSDRSFRSLLISVRDAPPYRGLHPFTMETRHLYFGRARDVQRFADDLLSHRITVLRGPSGIGKTSLILAGLVPELVERRHLPVVITAQFKPGESYSLDEAVNSELLTTLHRLTGRQSGPVPSEGNGSLRHTCRAVLDALAQSVPGPKPRLCILVDQLEAFLLGSTREYHGRFFQSIIDCDHDYSLDVGFLFAIRAEFFHLLEAFVDSVVDLASRARGLPPLDAQGVRDAIVRPAEKCGVKLQTELVDEIVRDLVGSGPEGVVTPQVQIVATFLYEAAHREGSRRLDLRLYLSLGGCRGILQSYLQVKLDLLPPALRDMAKRVLAEMTTGSGTSANVTRAELVRSSRINESDLSDILERLVKETWLVRRGDPTPDGQPTYHLAHEYLVPAIQSWMGPDEVTARRLRQHLGMLYRTWFDSSEDDLFLMSGAQLAELSGKLGSLDVLDDQIAFVVRSALLGHCAPAVLREAWGVLKDPKLLTDLVVAGLSSRNLAICRTAYDLATRAVPTLGLGLWEAMPNLAWHARQSAVELLREWGATTPIFEVALHDGDWRLRSGAVRIRHGSEGPSNSAEAPLHSF